MDTCLAAMSHAEPCCLRYTTPAASPPCGEEVAVLAGLHDIFDASGAEVQRQWLAVPPPM